MPGLEAPAGGFPARGKPRWRASDCSHSSIVWISIRLASHREDFSLDAVREFQSSSLGLAGSLLIAHPNLLDPNFRRTILYIAANDPEEGSFGLILNREANKRVAELVDEPGLGPLAQVPVFYGGPVGVDQLSFAAFTWRTESQIVECRANLDLDEARHLALEPDVVLRGFVGYAGWSAGQLESELEQKAWVVQKPDRDLLDAESCKQLWFSIMQDYGPWFRLLASAPDDPSLN